MKRLVSAFINSFAGMRHGFVHETAIRQEMIAFVVSIPAALFLTSELWKLLALWGSLLLILIAELLNTGIEQVANKVTRDYADEIKIAKDCSSAAVFLACVIAAAVWGIVLLEWFSA